MSSFARKSPPPLDSLFPSVAQELVEPGAARRSLVCKDPGPKQALLTRFYPTEVRDQRRAARKRSNFNATNKAAFVAAVNATTAARALLLDVDGDSLALSLDAQATVTPEPAANTQPEADEEYFACAFKYTCYDDELLPLRDFPEVLPCHHNVACLTCMR
jgi:hypothetical protein